MSREETIAEKIAKGIADKIECNTADIDDWAEFWGFTQEDYEEFLDMAIKALNQDPCEDAVSREDAMSMILCYGNEIKAEVMDDIKASMIKLPPATPTQNWIPVNERLPKPFTYVNATCRSLVDDRENWVIEAMYLPIPKENNEQGYSDWGNIPMLNWGKAEVIAWMERKIPEPYKEGEGE